MLTGRERVKVFPVFFGVTFEVDLSYMQTCNCQLSLTSVVKGEILRLEKLPQCERNVSEN